MNTSTIYKLLKPTKIFFAAVFVFLMVGVGIMFVASVLFQVLKRTMFVASVLFHVLKRTMFSANIFSQEPKRKLFVAIVGKHRYFSVNIYSQILEKYLSLGGIYLLIPRNL